jgi:peroxiredoxin
MNIGSPLELDLVDTSGTAVHLQDYRGRSNVFVYFMRATTCAQCNAAVRALARQRDDLRSRGVEVLIAVPSDTATAAAWQAKQAVPFPVVTGRTGTAHEDAGLVRKVFGAIQQSGGILTDRSGIVRYAHVSTNPGASYKAADLDAAIRDLGD